MDSKRDHTITKSLAKFRINLKISLRWLIQLTIYVAAYFILLLFMAYWFNQIFSIENNIFISKNNVAWNEYCFKASKRKPIRLSCLNVCQCNLFFFRLRFFPIFEYFVCFYRSCIKNRICVIPWKESWFYFPVFFSTYVIPCISVRTVCVCDS